MEQYQYTYTVTGMSCAACSARVEKAVSALPGVTSCAVSLLTASMVVEGTAPPETVIAAVEKAGYGAARKGEEHPTREDPLRDREPPALLRRLAASVGVLLILMYITMGHVMWGWRLFPPLAGDPAAIGLAELLLTAVIMVINRRFFISGVRGVLHRAPNMDTLVAMGAGAAFIYSTWELFVIIGEQSAGQLAAASERLHGLYFESAGMILTLITVGKMLEARSKGRTTDALRGLMELAPRTATLLTQTGEEIIVPAERVAIGDVFVLRPGETVPVDGVVEDGGGAVDESSLTGESIPTDKAAGDPVYASTVNRSGFLRCRATRVGENTTLSRIIRLVEEAGATKAPIARTADRVSGIFVPAVMGIAVITLIVWLLVGRGIGYALARAIAVLVISCPCALGLATPVAIMVGSGVGARHGILFKTAASLEQTGRVRIVALDKTGTVTRGEPEVTDICPLTGDEEELLSLAYSLEVKSEHPLARAICRCAQLRGIPIRETAEFRVSPGNGLSASSEGHALRGGNRDYIASQMPVPPHAAELADALAAAGKTPLYFAADSTVIGLIAVADEIKPDSVSAIRRLQEMGLRVVMLTGDNPRTAQTVGETVGVDEVIAGVLPDGKQEVIRRLSEQGITAMVGDGINDAPALTQADVGIAIGAGTDVAIDAADVVLMHSRLTDVSEAIRFSRATLRNIRENLFWAFIYNAIGIPLAAGAFIPWLGWQISPMFAAAAMSLSSFCVVTNALRLNLFRFDDRGTDIADTIIKEEKKMAEKTIRVEGMMCPHCEAHVREALEALPGVTAAVASHQEGTVTVTMERPVADDLLTNAITAAGYQVVG